MKKSVYIFLLLAIPLSLNAYTFTRTLRVGSTGDDVLQLQKYLNSNSATQVSDTGVGSPGNESTFFGLKTQQAVIKLQNLFSDTILKPLGLNIGSGFVGVSTLNFLNGTQSTTSSTSIQNPTTSSLIPTITSVTPEDVQDGDMVTIIGTNFSPTENTLILGFESRRAYTNIESTENGTKIEFEYVSSIQTVYDEKYSDLSKKAKEKVLKQFQKVPIAVSVIPKDNEQSNFKIINFTLK